MTAQSWQVAHLADIRRRLAWLSAQPEGVLLDVASPLHHIRVVKQSGQVLFYFVDAATGALDGPMSRMALDRPLELLAEYTQAAMAALVWRPEPRRVCLLGLAGGRLALAFYHYFPALAIDNVDVDPAVGAIAADYFGLTFDDRQRLTIQDARAFLRAQPPGRAYDIVMMDAFGSGAEELPHLATAEFYAECRTRLARGGVLCANILRSDSLFFEKVKTFLQSFRQVYVSEHKHGLVLLGSDWARLARADIARRARELQRRHGFKFPFEERASALRPAREVGLIGGAALHGVRVLRDPLGGETR